ncbi:MAG TPA: hypothetical protein VHR66_03015 [Gemmataceae bacterium]|jgi:hypothetical protein|nr:hypothetical protein [Gemmataceae bacterium]
MTQNSKDKNQSIRCEILALAHHRNGICGVPFHVAIFREGDSKRIGILFPAEGHCAVLDLNLLGAGEIRFGFNSWRGDQYESPLRQAIAADAAAM